MLGLAFELQKAGGSGRKFVSLATGATLFLHEPHPGKILKSYQVGDAIDLLKKENPMSSTLQHRNYDGSVLYSAEDKCLHGRVLGTRDMISYGGVTVDELDRNFRAAVDEYLSFCKETGKTPDKPFKGSLNLRISHDLHLKATRLAEQRKQKLNAVISDALEDYLAKAS